MSCAGEVMGAEEAARAVQTQFRPDRKKTSAHRIEKQPIPQPSCSNTMLKQLDI